MGSHYSRRGEINTIQYVGPTPLNKGDGSTKTWALTEDGDISFGEKGRSPIFISGLDKIKQDIYFILKTVKGSSLHNPLLGIDLLSLVSGDYDVMQIETEITEAVLMYPTIATIKDIKVKYKSEYASNEEHVRNYYVEFFAVTVDGDEIFVSVML